MVYQLWSKHTARHCSQLWCCGHYWVRLFQYSNQSAEGFLVLARVDDRNRFLSRVSTYSQNHANRGSICGKYRHKDEHDHPCLIRDNCLRGRDKLVESHRHRAWLLICFCRDSLQRRNEQLGLADCYIPCKWNHRHQLKLISTHTCATQCIPHVYQHHFRLSLPKRYDTSLLAA